MATPDRIRQGMTVSYWTTTMVGVGTVVRMEDDPWYCVVRFHDTDVENRVMVADVTEVPETES